MLFRDNLKFLYAKIFRRETILFSKKYDWEKLIKNKLKKSTLFFYEFDEVDPNIFDIVVPLSLHAQKYANEHPKLLESGKALIPSNYCIDLCDNKKSFHDFLVKNNFGMYAPKINNDLIFPYILKKKVGVWGVGISIIYNSQDELENLEKIESDDYFREEYILGKEEYTAHVVIKNKSIVFFKAVKFIFSEKYFVKGKDYKQTSQYEVNHSRFKQTFENILITMDYQGICCFNYKIVNQGLMIFEMNPRYGSSMTDFLEDALPSYRDAISNI